MDIELGLLYALLSILLRTAWHSPENLTSCLRFAIAMFRAASVDSGRFL